MIHESYPYKRDLQNCANIFRNYLSSANPLSERQHFKIEKETFVSFYIIRMLAENHKLSDQCTSQKHSVTVYTKTSKALRHFNSHHLDEHYDFTKPKSEIWQLEKICNQFIHSYIFILGTNESGGVTSVFVNSDKQKGKSLLEIDESVAKDDVVSSSWSIDPKTGEETHILSNEYKENTDGI